ncbi:Ig-like domain-containing protein [Aquimarina sp. 2304DJ70-9]|uniref:Ig-like domain-containing protein n=1 Tax=Aquimarina penaris TaxID=3231044 RepID=UPI0034620437
MKYITRSIFFLSLLLSISCSDDDPVLQNPGIEGSENPTIQFEDNDISFNFVDLKWQAATGPNNETIVYDIFLGDTKIKDSNKDTDYTLTKLEANTEYSGRIVPKIQKTSSKAANTKMATGLSPILFTVRTKQFSNPDAPTPEISNINVNNVTNTGATLNWDTATISDGSEITYNIYLEGDLVTSSLTTTTFTFEDLEPKTLYKGVLLAISTNQKSAALDFEFTTLPNSDEIPLTSFTFYRGASTSYPASDWLQLIPIFSPANANAVDLTWTSSDDNIAVVDKSGYINTKNIGVTIITATFVDDPSVTRSIELTVTDRRPIDAKFISAQPKRSSLLIGDSKTIQVNKFNIEGGSADDSFTFSSSDASIASVDNSGTVTGLKEGTVAITVTSTVDANITASVMLRIVQTPIPISNFVFFYDNPLSLFTGQSRNIYPRIEPEDATNQEIIFTSTNTNVIEIYAGNFAKAVGEGNASVIITSVADNSITTVRDFVVVQDPTSYDEVTGIYKATANSKVTLSIDGFAELAQGIDPNSAYLESTFSVKDKNGQELLTPEQQIGDTVTYWFDDPDLDYININIETNQIVFTMPDDGEVTIDVSLIVNNSNDFLLYYVNLTIANDIGFGVTKTAPLREDQIILN